MCQAEIISHNVSRLGKRTYSHRLEISSPNEYHLSQLVRLNHELDNLYELIYDGWREITEEDYRIFGEKFSIMLQTLKQLYNACRKLPRERGFREETKRLGMNYSALYELHSDIVNFCIKMPKNQEIKQLMNRLAGIDNRLRQSV